MNKEKCIYEGWYTSGTEVDIIFRPLDIFMYVLGINTYNVLVILEVKKGTKYHFIDRFIIESFMCSFRFSKMSIQTLLKLCFHVPAYVHGTVFYCIISTKS